MKKKILVAFVEAGLGHIVASQAILDALNEVKDDSVEIIAKDIFHENEKLNKYENFLIKQVKKSQTDPLVYSTLFSLMHVIGSQNTLKLVHSTVYKKYVKLYMQELDKIKPDVIIDTHYFTSYASICYRDKYNPSCKVITYNPDNNVHGWWCRKVDYFIVNNEMAFGQAIKAKFGSEKVKKVYFIIRNSVLNASESKEFYREKYGIPMDRFAVKIADGAYANGKLESFVRELCKTDKPLTIVAIAGKNPKVYDKLVKLSATLPDNVKLMPFGFVQNIEELFGACDLFITKAGPNAILDSVFMRAPVMVNYWSGTIEKKANELFVDKLGCGVTIKNKVKAREFVERCIENRSLLDEYILNEMKLDKTKNGAVEIAELVLNVIKDKN